MSAVATIAHVLSGEARWCVVEGDCVPVLRSIDLTKIQHVITDGPYGVGSYAETDDDGPYVEALRLLGGGLDA